MPIITILLAALCVAVAPTCEDLLLQVHTDTDAMIYDRLCVCPGSADEAED